MTSLNPPLDDLSTQLQTTLRESITRALSTRRPLLTHLNADTTWLLSLPYPESSKPTPNRKEQRRRKRIYYHILIDPWLSGGQSDVAKFFSQQWHAQESAAKSIEEVEEVIRGIEEVARGGSQTANCIDGENTQLGNKEIQKEEDMYWIDIVVISHEFTDHMHKDTLLEIHPDIPVLATTKAASAIRSWRHFNFVAEIPRFSGDWRHSSTNPLPEWVGISRVAYPGADLLYYHSAIMVTFSNSSSGGVGEEQSAEVIIYTPHGILPSDLAPVAKANPRIDTLALLHGLHDISLGAQLNMGAHNGLKVQRLLRAKYWVATHDEVKRGGGIVSWFLDRKVISLRDAVEREREENGGLLEGSGLGDMNNVRFEELGNGESLILE